MIELIVFLSKRLVLILVIGLMFVYSTKRVEAVVLNTSKVTVVGKLFGGQTGFDDKRGVRNIMNQGVGKVAGTDLGATAKYKGEIYSNLGDTIFDKVNWSSSWLPKGPWGGGNFFVAKSNDAVFSDGIKISSFIQSEGGKAKKAIRIEKCHKRPGVNDCYTIPNSMFTIKYQGQEYMFAQYMEVQEVGGHDHHIYSSRIAKYDDNNKIFKHYKYDTYYWTFPGVPGMHFDFGMASFVQRGNVIYMYGSPSGRFGGMKLATINTADFLDSDSTEGWKYYTGQGSYSSYTQPTTDMQVIRSEAKWIIEPADPDYHHGKQYEDSDVSLMTIAEFSVIYNSAIDKYMIFTGLPDWQNKNNGIFVYTSTNPAGPWEKDLIFKGDDGWNFYGTYTSDYMIENDGKRIYVVASNFWGYGVYLLKLDLDYCFSIYRSKYDVNADFNCDEKIDISDLVIWYKAYR